MGDATTNRKRVIIWAVVGTFALFALWAVIFFNTGGLQKIQFILGF